MPKRYKKSKKVAKTKEIKTKDKQKKTQKNKHIL